MKKKFFIFLMLCLPVSVQVNGCPFELDDVCYDISGETAQVIGGGWNTDEEIVIASTITAKGTTYDVTSIGDNAFSGSKLTSVVIPKSVTNIGYFVFENCTDLSSITVLNPVPVEITPCVFEGVNISACTLKVPAGAVVDYKNTDVWKEFDIVGTGETMSDGDVIVMKGGAVVFQSSVSAIDSVIFYNPVGPVAAPSEAVLFIYKANERSFDETLLLDDIRKLFISGADLSVETRHATSLLYAINDIVKLNFSDGTPTCVSHHEQDGFNIVAYFTMEGELVVESPDEIQSLALFNIDGKMIAARNLPAGIYLVRIETPQGVVVKKVVKQ